MTCGSVAYAQSMAVCKFAAITYVAVTDCMQHGTRPNDRSFILQVCGGDIHIAVLHTIRALHTRWIRLVELEGR